MTELKGKEVFLQDAEFKAKLERAVAPLLPLMPKAGPEFKFYIIESPLPNAFALPGGHVLVNDRLIGG